MNYIPLASAPPPLCAQCGQGGIILSVRSSCGCILPLHLQCQPLLQSHGICPYCRTNWINSSSSSVVTTEITYHPDRRWILYSLFCIAILIALGILCWFLYKAL